MNIKLPFGLQNEQLVDISSVDGGLACNCICPCCRKQLIAKKGRIKEHHFAHYNSEECKGAIETALHIYAKDILENQKRIILPPVYLPNSNKLLFPSIEVYFDKVLLEKRIDNIIPDLVVFIKGKPLIIEVIVTHRVNRVKAIKIAELGYSAIAVYVRGLFNYTYYKAFGLQNFEKLLIEETKFKIWINNQKQNQIREQIKTIAVKKKIINLDGFYGDYPIVDNCPINKKIYKSGYKKGQSYASACHDCWNCQFGNVISDKIYSYDGKKLFDCEIHEVYCSGHQQEEIDNIIDNFKKRMLLIEK